MQKVLPTIIHGSQTGFIKGCNINEKTMKLVSLMSYAEYMQKSAWVISFDFRKAFDRVKWEAIFAVLKVFNFGESFIAMTKVLYNDIFSTVLNNGFWGDWFSLQCSTRQGCPYSALIFLVVAEVLGIKIQSNIEIQGIEMYSCEIKSAQYADDIWVAIEPKEKILKALLQEMHDFYKFSGLSINLQKSIAFKLGPCRNSDAQYYSMKQLNWTDDPVKILRIWFHPDPNIMQQYNYFDKLPKIQSILNMWSTRQLTLIGKITIINTLVLSLLMYPITALPTPPDNFYARLKGVLMSFLWNDKPPKIKYDKLIQSYENGGLKLIHLPAKEIALKAKWPLYFKNRQDLAWLYGPLPLKDHRIWCANISETHIKLLQKSSQANHVVFDIWKSWSKIYFHTPDTTEEFEHELVWGNSHILRAGLPFFNKSLLNSNFDRVQDWFDTQGQQKRFTVMETALPMPCLLRNAVKAAIPKTWYEHYKLSCKEVGLSRWERIENYSYPSKNFYWELIEKSKPASATALLWTKDFNSNYDIDETIWASNYIHIMKVTNSTKLRIFQYKILNRTLMTNAK